MQPPKKLYRLLSLSTSALCTLLLALCIAALITSRKALEIRDQYPPYNRGSLNNNIYPPGQRDYFDEDFNFNAATGWYYQALPRNIRYGNEEAVLGCSAVVLVLVTFPLVTSAIAKPRPNNHTNPSGFPRLNIFLASCSLLVSLIGLIYTQVAIDPPAYDFSRFNTGPAPEDLSIAERTMGDTGTFSLESWSCQARGFMTRGPGFEAGDLEGSCGYAIAARWLMIPLFVGTAVLAVFATVTRKVAMKALEKERSAGKGIVLDERVAEGVVVE